MKIKKCLLIFFVLIFLLNGCSTFRFGKSENFFSEKDLDSTNDIREFDLSYNYKIMGINVNGKKSVIENVHEHPDGENIFIFISFPKIGILKSSDFGKTFKSCFFNLKNLEYHYGYFEEEQKESDKNQVKERYFSLFASSVDNPEKIVVTLGSYIFISTDYGDKWTPKNIFYDDQKSNIVDLYVTDNNTIVAITENKIAYSKDFGKTWKINYIKIPKIDFFKVEYICGFYDNSNDTLFASIKNQNEDDATLSKQSFDFFYNNRQNQNTSGLYFTKDFGKTWNKTKINIPVALWKCNEIIYGSTIYPLSFYKKELSENLKKSSIYKTGKINSESSGKEDFLKTMLSFETDDYQIISIKNNKLIKFNDINNYEIIEEKDFTNIYYGLKKLENIPFIHNTKSERTVSNNIYYEYEPYRFFKLWSGFKINSPVLYAKYGDIFYRVRPLEKYLNNFIRYSLENQIKFNSTNPFLRRVNDVEFFDPTLDPTNGFPIVFECSKDFGTTWDNIYDTKHIKTIIDPLGTKRNVFYWLKNVEEKKNFKLRISFGFGDAPNLLLYPTDLKIVDKDLFIIFNYFSLNKNYQDGYLLPIK